MGSRMSTSAAVIELVERLAELGYDSLLVDPVAPTHERLIRQRIEDVEGLGRFDAVTGCPRGALGQPAALRGSSDWRAARRALRRSRQRPPLSWDQSRADH